MPLANYIGTHHRLLVDSSFIQSPYNWAFVFGKEEDDICVETHVPTEALEIATYRSLLQLAAQSGKMDDKQIERALDIVEIEFRADRISSEQVYKITGILCNCNGH